MLKEIRYLMLVLIISIFIFFTVKYYFSDNNKKNLYRSLGNINERIEKYAEGIPILEDNTENIIEYVENSKVKKRKFNFWKLLETMNNRRSFIVGIKSTKLSIKERAFLKEYKPWGVILFTRNIKNINRL